MLHEIFQYLPESEKEGFKKSAKLLLSPKLRSAHAERLANQEQAKLASKFGLDIDWGGLSKRDQRTGGGTVITEIIELKPLEAFQAAQVLLEELEKYPASYISSLEISRIRLVKSLVLLNKSTKEEEQLSGFAEERGGRVYLSARYGDEILRKVIHHEFFHRSDYRLSDESESRVIAGDVFMPSRYIGFNKAWKLLNSERKHNPQNHSNKTGQLNDDGTIIGYAHFEREACGYEDRAYTAENLMTHTTDMTIRAEDDEVLGRKVKAIKALFKKRSKGLMDEEYFQDLIDGKVGLGYWDQRIA